MFAILFDQPGDPDVLYLGQTSEPVPGPGELLVRVRATGVNRAETLQRRGAYAAPPGASPILGLELAGEVVQAAGAWQVGDRVMAVVTGGGYAELATVPASVALRVPDTMGWEEAAAIPEVFLTAYLNLFTLGRLQAGERVLIHAGASGVGTAAIQLAKAAGATVFVTAGSDAKCARCRELGATTAINYRTQSFAEVVRDVTAGQGVDVILDFIGAPYWNDNLAALALGGRLQLIGMLGGVQGQLNLAAIMAKSATVTGTTLRRTPLAQKVALTETFAAFALPRFASGELKPVIDTILPWQAAAEAHRLMESNQTVGKIILRVES
jgi:putative PIG3 family NAD(P)H quinone oxidoreductase